jgi:hypothetical protein
MIKYDYYMSKFFWSAIIIITALTCVGKALAQSNFSFKGPTIPSSFSSTDPKARFVGLLETDLTKAGFNNVKSLAERNGQYVGPAQYFQVNGRDLVLVSFLASAPKTLFVYGHNSQAYGTLGHIATLADGRSALNLVSSGHYAVIIGPDQQKVIALADILVEKLK